MQVRGQRQRRAIDRVRVLMPTFLQVYVGPLAYFPFFGENRRGLDGPDADVRGRNVRVPDVPRISLLSVDGLRPSSMAMARMLRRACKRSAIVFRQLIIVSPCRVLRRGASGLPRSFHLSQLQLLKAQVLQRPLNANPLFRFARTARAESLGVLGRY
jgi:hypothetical protein